MTSSINPNNIDGTYPIAGQDNDSQGFRDNFTNIKNNFTFAYDELTDLQSKAVLKSALSGGSLNNDMAYAQLVSPQLLKSVETINNLGSKSGVLTPPISWADGNFQKLSTSGSITLAFSNWPTSGYYARLRLQIDITNTAHTVTFPSAVSQGLSNVQGVAGSTLTATSTGIHLFELTTDDNGTTITIQDLLRNYDAAIDFSTVNTTSVNATGNVLATGLRVFGNTNIGLAGAVSGQFHSVVGNITQTSSGGAVYINTTGNLLAAAVVAGSITSTGYINTSGNISTAQLNAGQINTTGNVLASGIIGASLNVNGNVLAAGAVVNALTVNGTTTRAGATVDSSYQIYKPTANISIQANVNVSRVIVAPISSVVSFWTDVILPNVSTDGHTVSISSNVAIETFRVLSPWVGYTVDSGANVALASSTPATFIFHSAENKWFKV